jgi:hypothetical protein
MHARSGQLEQQASRSKTHVLPLSVPSSEAVRPPSVAQRYSPRETVSLKPETGIPPPRAEGEGSSRERLHRDAQL